MEAYENHTVTQLKAEINNYPFNPKSPPIYELYRLVWEKENTPRHAIGLVRSLRKEKKFEEAKKFHDKFQGLYPDNKQLEGERLWFIFSSKVCDSGNDSYVDDAEEILNLCTQEDPRTKLIFEVTTLFTISRLLKDKDYPATYQWLSKLNPNVLSTEGRESDQGIYYESNKKRFYNSKARTLIGLDRVALYLDWVYNVLNFSKEKKDEFINRVISHSKIKYEDGYENWSFNILGKFLYDLDKELTLKRNLIKPFVENRDYIRVSELSQYSFCPASYVINRSFSLPGPVAMDSHIWQGKKDDFSEIHKHYQTARNINACFDNIENGVSPYVKKEFELLLNTKIIEYNKENKNPVSFRSDKGHLIGAPDYILETPNGERVLLMEKFSTPNDPNNRKVFDSEIIEIEAYLTKFKSMNITVGYFLHWAWRIEIENMGTGHKIFEIKMVAVMIKKLNLNDCREYLVDNTVEKITSLLSNVSMPAKNIGYARKCLNCSDKELCYHKSGELENLKLPYEMQPLNL